MKPFKFLKGQRNKPITIRDLIIMFFAHWTGYASDGRKTGISSNPTAARLEEKIYETLGDAWDIYEPKNPAAKIYKKILEIEDKYKPKYNPDDSSAPYFVGKLINAAWPEIEQFLNTTPLLDNIGEKANKLARKHYINGESKMKNITFKYLKKILTEEMYRYDYRDTDEWGSEIDDAKRWEISYYFRNNGQFAGTAVVSAATREEARRSFFEDDLAFDRRKVKIGSIRLYEED